MITGLALAGAVAGAGPAGAATLPHAGSVTASAAAGKTTGQTDTSPAKLPAQLSAAAKARATGKPVPVDALTTETLAVTANPDGSMTMTSSARPVRVQKGGAWVPITTTLTRDADGTYSPVASALPMAFSGGGTAPLVTVTDPTSPAGAPRTVSLSWPTPLPTPTISGNTALYPQVFPGVDLRMAAAGDAYTEVLIVHDAAAAANPALNSVRLRAVGHGLAVKQDSDGRIDIVDSHGSAVFTSAAPVLWDSTASSQAGPAPSADRPGSGVVKPLGTTITKAAAADTADITLTPPATALTDAGNKYPLYLDPGLAWQQNQWVTVAGNNNTPVGSWLNGSDSNSVEVGYCGYSDCHLFADFRTYFEMNTTPLAGSSGTHATVSSATFNIVQIWNGPNNCTATEVDLYTAGPISGSTTYPGPEGTKIGSATSGAGNGCPTANVSLNAQPMLQSAANNWWSNSTFELRAPSTTDDHYWKQFQDNPTLVATYYYPPSAATSLFVTGVNCNNTFYVNTLTPTLTAKANDNNSPPLSVNLHFSINGHTGTASNTPSGSVGQWQVPAGALIANTSYTYTVSVDNTHLSAPSTTTSGAFTVLTQPPTKPTITSFDYPPDYWGQPSATGGAFTITSPDPNLQGFIYTLTGPGTERAADSTSCATKPVQNTANGQPTDGFVPTSGGSAAISIPPGLSVGYHTLNVQAVDYANIPSPESATYAFYVSPNLTQPTANFALNASVTASQVNSNWPASSLTNGVYQATSTDTGWSSPSHTTAAGTESVQLKLTAAATIDDVDLYPRDDTPKDTGSGFPAAFTIATSSDGATWTTQDAIPGDYPKPGDSPQRFTFLPVPNVQYIKITATTLTADSLGQYHFQLQQIAAYGGVTSSRYESVDGNLVTPSVTGANGDNPYILTQVGVYSGLSSGAQTYFVGSQRSDVYTLTFSVPTAGYYALGASMTRGSDYGQVSYTVDGNALTANGVSSFDSYRSTCCDTSYAVLGGAQLSAGTHVLNMTVTGKNTASTGYNAGVDYLTVAPVSDAAFPSFAAAMNNHGIAIDRQASTASFDLGGGNNALSSGALAAAGLNTTSVDPINGYAFQLTAPSSGGYDNVIALGQTIANPVPSNPTSSIALLAAATCGVLPSGYVTITYSDGSTQQDATGSVPTWNALSSGINPAVTMGTYDVGSAGTPTSRNTYLYTVPLATNATKTIASITLPSFASTTMIKGTCSSAMHVLAIGARPSATTTVGGMTVNWVGAWAAPADTATGSSSTPAISNQTLREIVHPTYLGSGTGAEIRIRLTNSQGASTVTFGAVTLAAQAAGTGPATLNGATPTPLKFNNSATVTLPPGAEQYSDPVPVPSTSGGSGNLIVSLSITGTAATAPMHSDASTAGAGPATYVASGNATADPAGSGSTVTWDSSGTAAEWLYVEAADVTTSNLTQGTVVVLGDQTSLGTGADGRTWVDDLPGALSTSTTAPNKNPGGFMNLSVAGATTASSIANLANTVQDEPNVRTVIIDLGTNDLLNGATWPAVETNLQQMIPRLKTLGYTVYLTSVPPDTTTLFTGYAETYRETLNNEITTPSNWGYNGFVDFDSTVTGCARGSSGSPATTEAALLTNGAPNAAYYQDLANAASVPVIQAAPGIGSL